MRKADLKRGKRKEKLLGITIWYLLILNWSSNK